MTEKQILKLVELWKKRLGLDLWDIEARVQECNTSSSIMECHRSTTYHRAVIRIPPWLLNGGKTPDNVLDIPQTDERIEAGIVHELLHCVRHGTHSMVMDRLDGQVHRDVYTVVTEEYRDLEELEIENLAVALTRSYRNRDAEKQGEANR